MDYETIGWKFEEEQDIIKFKVSLYRLFISYKEKNDNFVEEKPGR